MFLRDVSCYFSVLEEGQPREKLECWFPLPFPIFFNMFVMLWMYLMDINLWEMIRPNVRKVQMLHRLTVLLFFLLVVTFKLYDKDGNGLLDSSVSHSHSLPFLQIFKKMISAWLWMCSSHIKYYHWQHFSRWFKWWWLHPNRPCHPSCVCQEVDRIITQMMRAADYLGWDVTELRPVWLVSHFLMLFFFR